MIPPVRPEVFSAFEDRIVAAFLEALDAVPETEVNDVLALRILLCIHVRIAAAAVYEFRAAPAAYDAALKAVADSYRFAPGQFRDHLDFLILENEAPAGTA